MEYNKNNIPAFIIKSNNNNYKENTNKKIVLKENLGEGSYGVVFLLQNNDVIKIFKNSLSTNIIQYETNFLIPISNENRELLFYYKYIKSKNRVNNYIINIYAIGIIKDIFEYNLIQYHKNSYFIILPYCIPFYSVYNIFNKPLIYENNGLMFTLNIMKRLSEIIIFFENEYGMINLDVKLNNFMFTYDEKNLIMLDFSIIKSIDKKNNKYKINNNYYIWPKKEILLDYISSYSVCINGLELLFGYNKIYNLPNNNKINNFLKIIKKADKDKKIYNVFFNGLTLELTINQLLNLIKKIV
jgi:serine/threonine protein kinase